MQKKYVMRLSPEEREDLLSITRKGKHTAHKIIHAKVIVAAEADDKGVSKQTDKEIAISLGRGKRTVAGEILSMISISSKRVAGNVKVQRALPLGGVNQHTASQ